jgi:predicted permease
MHDLRYALRLIAQNRAFSATVILILALCIGANTAVLSVVNAAMVRPLPYPTPERLAQVVAWFRADGATGFRDNHDGAAWEAIRDRASAIDAAVFSGLISGVNIGVHGSGVYVRQQRVSAGYFRVLGVAPAIGREFTEVEDRAGGPPVVLLSHALWNQYFNADASAVGRGILLRGEPYTVVGVMPASFHSEPNADLWTPLRPSRTGEGGGWNYEIIARLRPGVSWRQASSQLAVITQDLKQERLFPVEGNGRLDVVSLLEGMTSELHQPLMLLWASVAFVFVLGCVNIGGMMLARASGRIGEIATRLALGASLSRIVRQLLVEAIVLGLLGGAAGVIAGWGGLVALRALGSSAFPFLETVELDWRVLAATVVLTLVAGLASGMVPAWQSARVDLRAAQTGARGIAGRKRFLPLGVLVSGQVALTIPLLVGAGLLLRTFLYLWNLNPGFDPNHVLTARFSMADARYATSQKLTQYYDKVLTRLHETPGIEAAAVTLSLPYERALNIGVALPGRERPETTNMTYVTPEYFGALRIRLQQGRLFTAADSATSAPVAVVNEAFVRMFLKGRVPVGQAIRSGNATRTIVGLVGNVKERRAGWGDFGPIADVPMIYVPATQVNDSSIQLLHTWFSPSFIVRSSLSGPALTAGIENASRAVDPLVPIAAFRSISELKMESLVFQRFLAALAGCLAGLAIVMSALGIYGLIANLVAERTRELGIRMALGSTVAQAVDTALRPGLVWVLAGMVSGSALALMLERFLKSFIWGVRSSDPVTLAGVGAGLLVATALASMIPAVRIVRLNPADTLRAE